MWKKNEDDKNYEGDKFLINQKNEVFYKIKEGLDKDIILTYKTNDYPSNLKEKMEIFFKYHNKIKQKIFEHENQTMSFLSENNSTSTKKTVNIKSDSKTQNNENSIISVKLENNEKNTESLTENSKKRNDYIYKKFY